MTWRRLGLVLALSAAVVLLVPQLYERSILQKPGTVIAEGEAYRYILDQPPAGAESPPLIVALHGYGGDMHEMREHTQLSRFNDLGYGVLYLEARKDMRGQRHWNARMTLSRRNDIAALVETIRLMQTEFGFDPDRTFVIGDSNGGFMAYTLACFTEQLVRAFVVVSGTMSGADWSGCPVFQTEPVLHLHGGKDTVVPLDGSLDRADGWGGAPALERVIEVWGARLGGSRRVEDRPAEDVRRIIIRDDEGRVTAEAQIHMNEGHDWPYDPRAAASYRAAIHEFFRRVTDDRSG